MDKYLEIVKKYWGFASFRKEQAEIIKSIGEGFDTLGLLPTGGGKSLTFQVPALAKEGVCLVISPLIALMSDQVDRLKKHGVKAYAIHSGLSYHEIMIVLENAVHGAYKLLYLSPERLNTDIFREKVKQMKVSFIAVDEAHCISQWGYDFRPSYLEIINLRSIVPDAAILALTATATPEVADDIQEKLGFRKKNVITSGFTRENLVYHVRNTDSKITDLVRVCKSMKGTGIVYVRSRRKTKEIAEHLQREGINADFYHAGLSYENRTQKQVQWSKGNSRIMIATNAFGMGIDKADVRFVIHLDLPDSPEGYFQEAGRAGRDNKKAFAVLLVNNHDKALAAQRLSNSFPEIAEIKNIYAAIANYLQVPIGGGKGIAYDFSLYDFSVTFRMNATRVYNALKLLEKLGYVELTDELNNPSRILFLVSRDDLYKFQIENPKFDGFIKLLLRSYTGVFSDYTSIDEELMSKRANIPRDLVYQYLVKLGQMKILSYIPTRKSPLLVYTEERLEEKSLHISWEFYTERQNRTRQRLDAMLNYAFNINECRNNLLLKYFGQEPENTCGKCDVCKSKENSGFSIAKQEKLKDEIIRTLQIQSLALNDLALNLKVKNDELAEAVKDLLDKEFVFYTDDGLLTCSQRNPKSSQDKIG